MKSTRIRRAHETLTIVGLAELGVHLLQRHADVADQLARRARPSPPRPSPASSVSCDSWKLVETSLTSDSGGTVVLWFEPLMRTTQRAGSHDGGETS